MALSAQEVLDLKKRCVYARTHGFTIAMAEEYAAELGYKGGDLPHGVKKFSPGHLLHLISGAQPEKSAASTKFVKAGKATKKAAPAAPKQDDIPTVPVDIKAVQAAVAAMKGEGSVEET